MFFLNYQKEQSNNIYLREVFGTCAVILYVQLFSSESEQMLEDIPTFQQIMNQDTNVSYYINFDFRI
jgi:hypothetical protein